MVGQILIIRLLDLQRPRWSAFVHAGVVSVRLMLQARYYWDGNATEKRVGKQPDFGAGVRRRPSFREDCQFTKECRNL